MTGAADPQAVMALLKEFQQRTVRYVFERLYLDETPTHRFLVADEVGLGKTLVARGVIAHTIQHLRQRGTRRVDVIYVCSNAAIAKQNVNRLNLMRDTHFEFTTRLTLLPIQLKGLQENEVNFVSFTPGTTFDLKSRGGTWRERLVLFQMLRGQLDLPTRGLRRMLRGGLTAKSWTKRIQSWDETIDPTLEGEFLKALKARPSLVDTIGETAQEFIGKRGKAPRVLRNRCYNVIGELRGVLARACVHALEPDLVILDEFQRFRHLLDVEDQSDAAELARALLSYRDPDTGEHARTLLLSATPYRMLTLDHEEEDDHYVDFLLTLRFLLEGREGAISDLESDLHTFRRGLYGVSLGLEAAEAARRRIERTLRSVMVRSERVGATVRRDAMLHETTREEAPRLSDLQRAVALDRVAQAVGAQDVIEYWKSSPYLLNLMRDYQLKQKLETELADPTPRLREALAGAQPHLLSRQQIERYGQVDPGNTRLRILLTDTMAEGQWAWLWMPPALPYLEPRGRYAVEAANRATKAVVFSAWNVVPDAIATICSYEAERRVLEADPEPPAYGDLHERRKGLLQFKVEGGLETQDRLGGMSTLALLYPCLTLARVVDPLAAALELGAGSPASPDAVLELAEGRIRELLDEVSAWRTAPAEGRVDQRWYWAALGLLDGHHAGTAGDWIIDREHGWRTAVGEQPDHTQTAFDLHVTQLLVALKGRIRDLGRPPDDLVRMLAELALASPAICSLRALRRLYPGAPEGSGDLLSGAAAMAEGFRSLFNQPIAVSLLRDETGEVPFWRLALRYGLDGNLQAVLDEYLHFLREFLGLSDHADADAIAQLAAGVADALSIRTSRVKLDDLELDTTSGRYSLSDFNLRTHFALRFGELKDDSGQVLARAGSVREAFNSPFRPFILATTSIGQEGLDFHAYCHALYHWNLPSNPVDLEQREGRIQRYKGHAVRKNVAATFGLAGLTGRWDHHSDPWQLLFELASESTAERAGDLIPYWIFEGKGTARIERHIPMLPMSREQGLLRKLKDGLAVYRLVFGQPRQEELLEYLTRRLGREEAERVAEQYRISLAPPA